MRLRPYLVKAGLLASLVSNAHALEIILPSAKPPLLEASSPTIYMQLDGRWYATRSISGPGLTYTRAGIFMPMAEVSFCRRFNGQPQTYGGLTLYASLFYFPIYHVRKLRLARLPGTDKLAMTITTLPGDIVCENEVPDPRPAVIFADGFDSNPAADTLFKNGFERGDRLFFGDFERP